MKSLHPCPCPSSTRPSSTAAGSRTSAERSCPRAELDPHAAERAAVERVVERHVGADSDPPSAIVREPSDAPRSAVAVGAGSGRTPQRHGQPELHEPRPAQEPPLRDHVRVTLDRPTQRRTDPLRPLSGDARNRLCRHGECQQNQDRDRAPVCHERPTAWGAAVPLPTSSAQVLARLTSAMKMSTPVASGRGRTVAP